ncbi:MAG: RluA family pseudouridine synthase [Paenibacillaceae bacterium]|nr:RluA family pseudouridine synthase [Paenibacillaceae bacterium]
MSGRSVRKGEWLEVRFAAAPADGQTRDAASLGVPDKLLRKLRQTGGCLEEERLVRLRLFPEEEAGFSAEWADVDVLHEDDFCLVANKPAGMPVHPSAPGQTHTLANAVSAHYEATGQACRVRHIHRLDDQTSGPVLYAKNELAQLVLDEAMRAKAIVRTYAAVAAGKFAAVRGTVDAAIGRDRHHAGKRRVSESGDPAVTHYEVVEQFREAALLRVRLETGRTHQIRVHMSHIGHPLLGDPLYGAAPDRRLGPTMDRQALHGESLGFAHPWTRETIRVESPLPADLAALLGSLRQKK